MGIYRCNFIFYGTILSKTQYELLISKIHQESEGNKTSSPLSITVRKVCDKYLLYVPNTYYNFGNIDGMFEAHEIKQGYVSYKEVEKCLQGYLSTETEVNAILNPNQDEIENLKNIVALLSDESISLKLNMGQSVYSTYDSVPDTGTIEHILEVRINDSDIPYRGSLCTCC